MSDESDRFVEEGELNMLATGQPISQVVGEYSAETRNSAEATRLLIQYRQSLLRELAEVDCLIAEREEASLVAATPENRDQAARSGVLAR
jgi:hypothetical protein